MAKKTMTLEHIDYSISRWKTRLKRAMTAIDKLEKQRKRIVAKPKTDHVPASTLVAAVKGHIKRATAVRASVPAHPTVDSETTLEACPPPVEVCDPPGTVQLKPVPAIVEVDTSIPSFLRRSPDPVAEAIKVEQAETKRLKATGRIAKMKAKQSGETRKMPLTGKAALAAIRGQ